MKTPYNYMDKSVFWKAYWNYTESDWHNWFNSFRNLPLKKYNEHIGSVIDMYFPKAKTPLSME